MGGILHVILGVHEYVLDKNNNKLVQYRLEDSVYKSIKTIGALVSANDITKN